MLNETPTSINYHVGSNIHVHDGKWCILYSAFNQSALHRLCITLTHSHTHSYTDGGGNHARHQPAHREQLGVQSLAQGLFDTNSSWGSPGSNREPSAGNHLCSNDGSPTPEPLSPLNGHVLNNRNRHISLYSINSLLFPISTPNKGDLF